MTINDSIIFIDHFHLLFRRIEIESNVSKCSGICCFACFVDMFFLCLNWDYCLSVDVKRRSQWCHAGFGGFGSFKMKRTYGSLPRSRALERTIVCLTHSENFSLSWCSERIHAFYTQSNFIILETHLKAHKACPTVVVCVFEEKRQQDDSVRGKLIFETHSDEARVYFADHRSNFVCFLLLDLNVKFWRAHRKKKYATRGDGDKRISCICHVMARAGNSKHWTRWVAASPLIYGFYWRLDAMQSLGTVQSFTMSHSWKIKQDVTVIWDYRKRSAFIRWVSIFVAIFYANSLS